MRNTTLRVVNPCPKRWLDLAPANGGRYCDSCERHVVDVEQLTRAELEALLEAGDPFCARIAILPNGEALTRDHPRCPLRRWSPSPGLAAVIAATSLACSPAPHGEADEEPCDVAPQAVQKEEPPEAARPVRLTEEQIESLRALGYVE